MCKILRLTAAGFEKPIFLLNMLSDDISIINSVNLPLILFIILLNFLNGSDRISILTD